jgi:hypothetical protein
LEHKVLTERKGFAYFVEMDYENLQDYCTFWKSIGLYIEIWKTYKTNETEEQAKDQVEK